MDRFKPLGRKLPVSANNQWIQSIRRFSVTKLSASMDNFSLIQYKDKQVYLCGISNTIPKHKPIGPEITALNTNILQESDSLFIQNTIDAIKPSAIVVQIDQNRANILDRLDSSKSSEKAITNELIFNESVLHLKNEFSLIYDTFNRSQSVINPFELFNLLLNKTFYDIIFNSATKHKSTVVYCDNTMEKNLKKFEESLESMYNFDNIKDTMMSDMTRFATGGKASKLPDLNDLHKIPPAMLEHLTNKLPNMPGLPQNLSDTLNQRKNSDNSGNSGDNDGTSEKERLDTAKNLMMKTMMEDMIAKRPKTKTVDAKEATIVGGTSTDGVGGSNESLDSVESDTEGEYNEYNYKNEELFDYLIDLGTNTPELECLKDIYNRGNARTIMKELEECMPVCVETLMKARNKEIVDTLLGHSDLKQAKSIVAVVNFANMDGIEAMFEKM